MGKINNNFYLYKIHIYITSRRTNITISSMDLNVPARDRSLCIMHFNLLEYILSIVANTHTHTNTHTQTLITNCTIIFLLGYLRTDQQT